MAHSLDSIEQHIEALEKSSWKTNADELERISSELFDLETVLEENAEISQLQNIRVRLRKVIQSFHSPSLELHSFPPSWS